jgi:hypothetical protein
MKLPDPEFSAGYEAYKRGEKVPRGASRTFMDGWWDAHDNQERFGKYESFLQAEDTCDHLWVSGGLRSDWMCDHCGERRNVEEA